MVLPPFSHPTAASPRYAEIRGMCFGMNVTSGASVKNLSPSKRGEISNRFFSALSSPERENGTLARNFVVSTTLSTRLVDTIFLNGICVVISVVIVAAGKALATIQNESHDSSHVSGTVPKPRERAWYDAYTSEAEVIRAQQLTGLE